MQNLANFSERASYAANKIAQACPNYRAEDMQTVYRQYNAKIEMAIKYVPKGKIKSDVSLIKASESIRISKMLSDTYDLNKVSMHFPLILFSTLFYLYVYPLTQKN